MFLDNFKAFMAKPYNADGNNMSALDWFLFVGFLLTILIAWIIITHHVIKEV